MTTKLEVALTPDGPWASSAELQLGSLWGRSADASVFVRNASVRTLTIPAFELIEPPLTVRAPRRVLAPTEQLEIRVTVASSMVAAALERKFTIESEEDPAAHVEVNLKGKVVDLDCNVPAVIDFGVLLPGQESVREVRVKNPSEEPVRLAVDTVRFQQGEPLAIGLISPLTGELNVAPGEDSSIRFAFRPGTIGTTVVSTRISVGPSCPQQVVTMRGRAVATLATVSPSIVDCGWQQPGVESVHPIDLFNQGSDALIVSGIGLFTADGGFTFDGWPPLPFELEPQATTQGSVRCEAPGFGHFEGTFITQMSSDAGALEVPLRLAGGGPVAVASEAIDFGVTSAVGGTRWVQVANGGGPLDAPAEVKRLSITRAEVVERDGGAVTSEFSIPEVPLTLEAGADHSLRIELHPRSAGLKSAVLRLSTNDVRHPVVEIGVSAVVRELNPCAIALNEAALEFGVVHATNPMTRTLVVRNTSIDTPCVVFGALMPGTPVDYSLAPEIGLELPPGGTHEYAIRLQPRQLVGPGVRPITGFFRLETSRQTSPTTLVPLSGAAGPACLGLLPTSVNFGANPPGTTTAAAEIRVVNHCVGDRPPPDYISPLFITGIEVVGDAAFEPAAMPNIPDGGVKVLFDGQQGTYENNFIAPHTVPLSMHYAPTTEGPHHGAVVFQITQTSRTWKQVVPLRGSGNSNRLNKDEFTQGGGDAVDVVLIMTESVTRAAGTYPSWSESKLAASASLLFDGFARANSDFHLGLLTRIQKSGSSLEHGLFATATAADHPLLTPLTASPAASMQARLMSPICRNGNASTGSCNFAHHHFPTYSIYRAVTEPNSSLYNGGGLRPGARLALLYFTEWAEEEATQWTSFQHSFLRWWSPTPVDDTGDILRLFQEMKGVEHPELLSFAWMTGMSWEHQGPDERCDLSFDPLNDPQYESPALVLKAAARAEINDICPANPADFEPEFQRFIEVATGQKSHFELSARAEPTSIEVKVDGVMQVSTTHTFDVARNEIRFQLASVPSPESRITVSYRTALP